MATPPRTSSKPNVILLVISVAVAIAAAGAFYAFIDKSDMHQPVYCPQQVMVTPGTSIPDLIIEAAAMTSASPRNIDTAVRSAPADTLSEPYASICFDNLKQNVATINGKLVPKD